MRKAGIGLNGSQTIHYLDHLAVICSIMEVPLLVVDELDFTLASRYYPGLQLFYKDYTQLSIDELIAEYDVFYRSDLSDREEFHQKYRSIEEKYQKSIRQVHCPHGFSDKAHYLKQCAREDILLLYGQNMWDMLVANGVEKEVHSVVTVGNYRYTYFQQHNSFYQSLMQEELLNRFSRAQPIILYAPTWMDAENASSFFDAAEQLLKNLPEDYNLVVKLHPRLELDDPVTCYKIIGKYEQKSNIVFLKDFPLVYPLLACTDIYLGDVSAIGYDFLLFNKPMFFLTQGYPARYLFRCGTHVQPEEYSQIYQIIDQALPEDQKKFGLVKKSIYNYSFGEEKKFAQIQQEILQACHTCKPLFFP